MRRFLDLLYLWSGAAAAVFLAAIAAIVLLQVTANAVNAVAGWLTGAPLGLAVPSYAEFAGFFLATSSFLALAHSLRRGSHIRVSLILQHIRPGKQRIAELWCAAMGAAMSGYFAWYAIGLVGESFRYGDLSTGMVAVPLWVPQAPMAAGLVILTIALVDRFVALLRARGPFDPDVWFDGNEGG